MGLGCSYSVFYAFFPLKLLADGVIPNEYGINPIQELKIGSKIACRLLGKILIDLINTHEEAISVAELKSKQDNNLVVPSSGKEYTIQDLTVRLKFLEELGLPIKSQWIKMSMMKKNLNTAWTQNMQT